MIGVLLSHSFDNEIIKNLYENNGDKCCVFSTGAITPDYPINFLQTLRVYDFKDTIVATDIPTAILTSKLNNPKKKYFYIRSLDWVGYNPLRYQELDDIYNNKELNLIVSNKKDYDIIKNLFREPERVVTNWNFSELEQ